VSTTSGRAAPGGPLFFEDLTIGEVWTTARRTVTEADITNFAGVSGDFNPLHTDAVFAADAGFGAPVAHGALILAIATGLRQQMGLFNGSLKALVEIRTWKFLLPVFAADTIRVRTTIVERRATSSPHHGIVVQHVDVLNQRDEEVQSGELVALMRTRAER
jgi:acyl dehydratase